MSFGVRAASMPSSQAQEASFTGRRYTCWRKGEGAGGRTGRKV
jgi:hypothetical protein